MSKRKTVEDENIELVKLTKRNASPKFNFPISSRVMIEEDDGEFQFGFTIEPPNKVVNRFRVLVWLDSSEVCYFCRRKVFLLKYQRTLREKLDNFTAINRNTSISEFCRNRTIQFIKWFHKEVENQSFIPEISTSKENMFTVAMETGEHLVTVNKSDCAMLNVSFIGQFDKEDFWLWKGDPIFKSVADYNRAHGNQCKIPKASIQLLRSYSSYCTNWSESNGTLLPSPYQSESEIKDADFTLDKPMTDLGWSQHKRPRLYTPPPEYRDE